MVSIHICFIVKQAPCGDGYMRIIMEMTVAIKITYFIYVLQLVTRHIVFDKLLLSRAMNSRSSLSVPEATAHMLSGVHK